MTVVFNTEYPLDMDACTNNWKWLERVGYMQPGWQICRYDGTACRGVNLGGTGGHVPPEFGVGKIA